MWKLCDVCHWTEFHWVWEGEGEPEFLERGSLSFDSALESAKPIVEVVMK